MNRPTRQTLWLCAPLLTTLTIGGCGNGKAAGFFQFHGTITKTKTDENGRTVTETQEFDNWADMKEALAVSAKELRATTGKLIKQLTEAPPPGEVKLSDLSSRFADYEGDANFDFLLSAESDEDHPAFSYVRIGVPSFDDFFQAAAEFHAFVYQTHEAIDKLRALARARIQATTGGRVRAKISLGDLVQLALEKSGKGHLAGAVGEAGEGVPDDLLQMRDLALSIGQSAPDFVSKTQRLIQTGRQLVMAAPQSITNPKTVLHLDLIKKGLEDSVLVVGDSGKLLGDMVKQLGTLRKG
ncbi:MAG: hypothetical protein K0V04_20775 [Deltaproteobacteria bacterium]|nr:hypothetical protein [Deltaproteobacteria bacterium]